MRIHRLGETLLLLVVAAAAPVAARAFSLSAEAGAQYARFDSYPAEGEGTTAPRLDLNLALDARGVIQSSDVFDWVLRAGWGRNSDETGGITSTRDTLSYSARAGIFENPVSPIHLSVFAMRGETDFSTTYELGSFGRGIETATGGTLGMRGLGRSTLSAAYSLRSSELIVGDELRDSTQHTVSSTLFFDTSAFQVNATYNGEFREGTWETDNFSTHGASIRASTILAGHALTLESSSAFTVPSGPLVAGMFDQRTTSFSARYGAGAKGNLRSFSYRYGHSVTESPGAATDEIANQGLRYQGDHFARGDTFFTRWIADLALADTRSRDVALGTETVLRTTGETLGVSGWYKRLLDPSQLELHAGPRVSLLQSEDGQTTGGYGVAAGVRVTRPTGLHSLQASWNLSYGSNLFANAGWQFTQDLAASLSGPIASGRYTLHLRANAFRTHSPVTGDGAGRSIELRSSLSGRRSTLDATVGVSNGIVGATPEQFTSDGLLLPAPFDSTVLDASLGGSLRLFSGLSATGRVRVARSDMPGRVLHETGAIAGLTYRFAALAIALEDRISQFETAAGWDTSNVFMATISRSFSW